MDPVLAELYGTNQVDESDVEKLAAAQMAEELADDEQIDTDEMSDDTIEALAQEVLGASAESEEEEYEASEDSEDEELQEKVAEADYMGRVMAHAYVQELNGIDKEAARKSQKLGHERYDKGGIRSGKNVKARRQAAHAAKFDSGSPNPENRVMGHNYARKQEPGIHTRINANAARAKLHRAEGAASVKPEGFSGAAKRHGGKVLDFIKSKGQAAGAAIKSKGRAAGAAMKAHPYRTAGGAAAGLAAAGGAAYALSGGKKNGKRKAASEMSAFDTLAEQRALEMLEEAGIEIESQETEKTAGNEFDVLAEAVEARAFEMLAEAGYIESDEEEAE